MTELGSPDEWLAKGKQFVDRTIETQYIGMSANGFEPGQSSAIWHAHAVLEEIYLFLSGTGEMALGDDVVPVGPGTTIRVAQGTMRAVHADETGPGLTYLCIRAGDGPLTEQPKDGSRDERPFPWSATTAG